LKSLSKLFLIKKSVKIKISFGGFSSKDNQCHLEIKDIAPNEMSQLAIVSEGSGIREINCIFDGLKEDNIKWTHCYFKPYEESEKLFINGKEVVLPVISNSKNKKLYLYNSNLYNWKDMTSAL